MCTFTLGYYHVAFAQHECVDQIIATIWFVGFQRPINATLRFIGFDEHYRLRIFTQVDTPLHVRHDLVEFGPWTFRVNNAVCRRL